MNMSFSTEDLAFRDEVREFLRANLPEHTRRAQRLTTSVFSEPDIMVEWHQALYRRGWVAPAWPAEYGGPGWTPTQRYLFDQECARAGAPRVSPSGINLLGPVLIGFGTPEQKAYYLPRILSGEDIWCQGYSEPGAGSDLASLRTRAVRDGDCYIVNGTKIWTTHAHHANRMFALVRTDDSGRKQDGITFLLIDMDSPGISVRPILTIGGEHEVNQVFLDDVRVPVANRVGEEGQGWSYGKYLLEFERGGGMASARLRKELEGVAQLAREAGSHGPAMACGEVRRRLVDISVDIDAIEILELGVLSDVQAGRQPGPVSSLLKLRVSQLKQDITTLGLDVVGPDMMVWESERPFYTLDHSPLLGEHAVTRASAYLNARAYTIFGGSSEIQHEILAKTMLRL